MVDYGNSEDRNLTTQEALNRLSKDMQIVLERTKGKGYCQGPYDLIRPYALYVAGTYTTVITIPEGVEVDIDSLVAITEAGRATVRAIWGANDLGVARVDYYLSSGRASMELNAVIPIHRRIVGDGVKQLKLIMEAETTSYYFARIITAQVV